MLTTASTTAVHVRVGNTINDTLCAGIVLSYVDMAKPYKAVTNLMQF